MHAVSRARQFKTEANSVAGVGGKPPGDLGLAKRPARRLLKNDKSPKYQVSTNQ
jgi:hypothetical protein